MTALEILVLILILILLALIVIAIILIGVFSSSASGQASVGPTEIPVDGVIHVRVSRVTCRSFSVKFETVDPRSEVYGTVELAPGIAQTEIANYSSPRTEHELTFSNGGYGLQSDTWYRYYIMGRGYYDRQDPEADLEIMVPFLVKTAKVCLEDLFAPLLKIAELETLDDISWPAKP